MIIWTLSLWDLKLYDKKARAGKGADLNFVPMGFETKNWLSRYCSNHKFELCPYGIWNLNTSSTLNSCFYLNFVPMGFETLTAFLLGHLLLIWTLSLWDLKLKHLRARSEINNDLNFVPMGFETMFVCCLPWCDVIWTLSLWDLKRFDSMKGNTNYQFELCPYGIWNIFFRFFLRPLI